MPEHLSVEELVIDDSFINYCFQKNEADNLYWEQYISDYPFETEKIEKEFASAAVLAVLGITFIVIGATRK